MRAVSATKGRDAKGELYTRGEKRLRYVNSADEIDM